MKTESQNGVTAYLTILENGNTKVEIEGVDGHAQFTDSKEADKFVEDQFKKGLQMLEGRFRYTAGEAYFAEKESMEMVSGNWVKTVKIYPCIVMPTMSKKMAAAYYTKKLKDVFNKLEMKRTTKVTLNMNREKMMGIVKEAYEAGRRSA